MNTSHPAYEAIGVRDGETWLQLNTNVLQIENEYYSDIRPKRVTYSGERPSHALLERGVEYMEVRCMDLNPFAPLGIDLETSRFLDLFLTWCWVKKSPHLARTSCSALRANQLKTSLEGSDGSLELTRYGQVSTIREWGLETVDRMLPLAELMEPRYPGTLASLAKQKARLRGEEETLSQRFIRELSESGDDYLTFTGRLSSEHKDALAGGARPAVASKLDAIAESSHAAQRQVEDEDKIDFSEFVRKWM